MLPFSKDAKTIRMLAEKTLVKDFYSSISTMSKSTAVQYLNRLNIFSVFLNKEFDGRFNDR